MNGLIIEWDTRKMERDARMQSSSWGTRNKMKEDQLK
jgi:hypothetical protein